MKILVLALLCLSHACASELTFEVVDEVKSQTSREQQMQVFLDAYDAFSKVAGDGTFKWQDFSGRHEVVLSQARLTCDVPNRTLKLTLPLETNAGRLDAIAHALQIATSEKAGRRMSDAVKQLQAKIGALQESWDAEKDVTRQRILGELINASIPPRDPPPGPQIGLRRKNAP
jgi:hypothetical protein